METEQMAEVWGAPGTRPSDISKAARKHAKAEAKRQAREQALMRAEMEAGVHKPRKLADAERETFGGPVTVGDVLDEAIAPLGDDADVTRMAHVLIEEHGDGLLLNLRGWGIVQRIVEAAVRVDPNDL